MGGKRRPLLMRAMCVGLFALGGCQPAMRAPGVAPPDAAKSGEALGDDFAALGSLPATPPCPAHLTAVLASGVAVRFMGSSDDDPDICIQEWNGRSHRYYLGFWGNGRFKHGTPQQRKALAAILRGPVGMTTTVDLHAPTRGALWKSATVTHEANTSLRVGRHKRPVVKLRVVRRDALGRNEVTAERLYWLDRELGIPLRKQTVTRLANGHIWHITTWEVSALRSAGAEPGAADGAATYLKG